MAPPVIDPQYRELLNPVKDPEKSFQINISQLLQNFVHELTVNGTTNFNSAALLIQGSASIYGKKVEYLHNLATQLYNNLMKQKNDDLPQVKEKEPKEKPRKEDKTNDIFQSTEIKIGKNLSFLKKRNAGKSITKKPVKQMKNVCIPVLLLTTENEDKGEIFNDTRGEPIGNKGDFALNLCRMTQSGWLLLPTINPNLVPSHNTVPEYYDDVAFSEANEFPDMGSDMGTTPNTNNDDSIKTDAAFPMEGIVSSSDEGYEECRQSNPITSSTPESEINFHKSNVPSSGNTSIPPSTDEGIGNSPADDVDSCHSSEGIENVPTNNENEAVNDALVPVRRAVRQALTTCQLAMEDNPLCGPGVDKNLIVRRKIQKKTCYTLPSSLKYPQKEDNVCISEYCARTFFSMDDKNLRNSLLAFDCKSFEQNNKFMKRIKERIAALKSINRKHRNIDPIEDEREIDVEGIENFNDADSEADNTLIVPFDDADIQIDNDPAIRRCMSPDEEGHDIPRPMVDDIVVEAPTPDINHIAFEQSKKSTKEIHQFIQNSDITERVHEWEKSVKPFLEEVNKRESFDIHLYGSRILNSFEDSNRKQTKTFREICSNKQKWEIHRYFMAILPLANIGNVSLETERNEDESDEIFVTLLSRKMHHIELEEFGHNDGSHS